MTLACSDQGVRANIAIYTNSKLRYKMTELFIGARSSIVSLLWPTESTVFSVFQKNSWNVESGTTVDRWGYAIVDFGRHNNCKRSVDFLRKVSLFQQLPYTTIL